MVSRLEFRMAKAFGDGVDWNFAGLSVLVLNLKRRYSDNCELYAR